MREGEKNYPLSMVDELWTLRSATTLIAGEGLQISSYVVRPPSYSWLIGFPVSAYCLLHTPYSPSYPSVWWGYEPVETQIIPACVAQTGREDHHRQSPLFFALPDPAIDKFILSPERTE